MHLKPHQSLFIITHRRFGFLKSRKTKTLALPRPDRSTEDKFQQKMAQPKFHGSNQAFAYKDTEGGNPRMRGREQRLSSNSAALQRCQMCTMIGGRSSTKRTVLIPKRFENCFSQQRHQQKTNAQLLGRAISRRYWRRTEQVTRKLSMPPTTPRDFLPHCKNSQHLLNPG